MFNRFDVYVVVAVLSIASSLPVLARAEEPNSRGRIEYLEQVYEHFARGQADAVAALLPREMSWHMIGWRQDVVPFAGEYSGRRQIRELLRDYFRQITIVTYQSEYHLSDGEYTTWHFRLVGRVDATLRSYSDTQLLV